MNSHEPQQRPTDDIRSESVERERKLEWSEPKLVFVEPELKKHGSVTKLTGQGFFGTFIP